MGTYYSVKCKKCEYKFEAYYGKAGFKKYDKEICNRLESENNNKELISVYKLLSDISQVKTDIDTKPFECFSCKDFFCYDCMVLSTEQGQYIENIGICPTCCKRSERIIYESRLKGSNEYGFGISGYRCPKCMELLEVVGGGLFD